ncbi:Gfo/Idh/MocA family oxidoreductase [Alteromonas sp. 345S023]|uniref:Gfo/Idh/MocA family oxidoreductase n=1 Tax=Alteromonas profundi TaxID=2696062 RepID=A0A7X5LN96_9ALTE|nr:Gfo/Idh/MocA family oxidoreductase [Alteromonas profundi]NDV92501.1 Gfo/Idh/MocA family oxidoreductase [Alteromonas profundi]
MLSTLLVGFGFSAQTFHLPFLTYLPSFNVQGVVSSQPNVVTKTLPSAKVYASLNDALNTESFDLVVITTPNHLHAEQAESALKSGAHVLVEKPFTLTSADARKLVDYANLVSKKLCVYQNRRFDGDFLTLKNLIEQGTLGNVRRVESRFDRFRPVPRDRWRENKGPGSGICWDLGPHLIDQSLCLFGLPEAIDANIATMRQHGQSDDCFDISLYYPDKVVKLGSSAFQAGPTLRFDVQGDKGSYRKFHLDPQEDQLRAGISLASTQWGQTPSDQHGTLYLEGNTQCFPTLQGEYIRFYHQLACAILEGATLPADAASVVPVIEIIEQAKLACEKGHRVRAVFS